jgi:hypothetical protein
MELRKRILNNLKQYTIIAFIWGEHRKPSGKTTLECWQLDVHFIARQQLFYYAETTLKMFKTWIFYSVEDNKIISTFRKYNCRTRLKKKISKSLAVVRTGFRDRMTTYCLPLHYICLDSSPDCLPSCEKYIWIIWYIFRWNYKL